MGYNAIQDDFGGANLDKSYQRALHSLAGLSVGDAFGENFFASNRNTWIRERKLPPGIWRWTDDTHMALSIVETIGKFGLIQQDELAATFARRFVDQPWRGYAGGAVKLLRAVAEGRHWQEIAPILFPGGSYGNGGTMRAAPIGGYFAGQPERATVEGQKSAMVTHAHPEGQAGAMAVAAAAAIAAAPDAPRGVAFLQAVLPFVPEGQVYDGIQTAEKIEAHDLATAVHRLGTGSRISAQDTVPFCLWCAAHHLGRYEEALWQTAQGFGDVDTTCAIVGGIVALSVPEIPSDWVRHREPLPEEFDQSHASS
jgi:ADP-ribosylglycohydrolase